MSYQLDNSIFTDWHWSKDIPREQEDFVWGETCYQNRAWTLAIEPKKGAREVIQRLYETPNVKLVIVTDRNPKMIEWVYSWLEYHDFPPLQALASSARHDRSKRQLAESFGLEIAVDDAPHHCTDFIMSGIHTVAVDQPWNRKDTLLRLENSEVNAVRATSWEEIEKEIIEYKLTASRRG